MEPDTDTPTGGEALSIDEAAAAYSKLQQTEPEGQPDAEEEDDSDKTDDELQASDEDEGEETDGEPDPNSEADEDPDAEPETESGRYVAHNGRVKLPGGSESTVSELIAGYMKDGDYRQKTTEAANLKREAAAEKEAIKQREQQLEQYEASVRELVQSVIPKPPDASMVSTDPVGYMQAKANYDQWQAYLGHLESQKQQLTHSRQAEAEKSMREREAQEYTALVEKVPALKDEAKLRAFATDVSKHGSEYGFTPQELQSIALDHRQALVFRDAVAWRKLQASKPKVQAKVENRPPIQKGGKRLNPSEHKARSANDALSRLKQSGSQDDAVAAYLASLNKG